MMDCIVKAAVHAGLGVAIQSSTDPADLFSHEKATNRRMNNLGLEQSRGRQS